ncbi:vacuolar protein sorting-associated protein 73 [Cenococcum geophilum]
MVWKSRRQRIVESYTKSGAVVKALRDPDLPLLFGFYLAKLNAPKDIIRYKKTSIITAGGFVELIFTLKGLLGVLSTRPFAVKYRRLRTMQFTTIFFAIGPIFKAIALNISVITIGRFILGISTSVGVIIVPIYLVDKGSLSKIRGDKFNIGEEVSEWGIKSSNKVDGINSIIIYSVLLLLDLLKSNSALLNLGVLVINIIVIAKYTLLMDKLSYKVCLLNLIIGMGISSLLLVISIINSASILSAIAVLLFVLSFSLSLSLVPFILFSKLVGLKAIGFFLLASKRLYRKVYFIFTGLAIFF